MRRSDCILLVSLLICGGVDRQAARADAGERWLFVPVLSGPDAGRPTRILTEPLERALQRERSVHANPSAALEFEATHSSEPVRLDDAELARRVRMVGDGIRSLAYGKRALAESQLEDIEKLPGPIRDFLQRSPARAQDLFDACALTAGLLLKEKQGEQAQRHMDSCVRTLPGYLPKRARARATMQLYEESLRRVDQEPHGTLTVRGSKPGCVVRMNGIELGKSPATLRIPWAARIQLECDADVPGRFHYVKLGTGTGDLFIDPDFEQAVHTSDALWLTYVDDAARTLRVDADAEAAGRGAGAAHVVLLVLDAATHRVTVRTKGRDVAELPFSAEAGYGPARLEDVVGKLVALVPQPKPVAATRTASTPTFVRAQLRPEPPDPFLARQQRETRETVRIATGISCVALGLAGYGVGWAMYVDRHATRSELYFGDVPFHTLEEYDGAGVWGLVGAGAGAAASIAAEVLLLPEAKKIPTAAWIAGTAGAALAVTGLGFSLLGEHCQPQADSTCQGVTTDPIFGPLLALQAAPLLAVPVIYAFRGWMGGERVQLSLDASGVSLRGTF